MGNHVRIIPQMEVKMKTEKKEEWNLMGSWDELMNFIARIPKGSINRVEIWKPLNFDSEENDDVKYFCLVKCEKKN